jgi:ElaB/YqjD/DUF883 family membrane-anchored ribosome-binding protein
MNQSHQSETDAIRSDIDTTRRRMDDTMDALGNRLQPRHLMDEFLGYLRGDSADGETRMTHLKQKIGHSCESAMHSVVDTVKQNPMPALLIGAGVGWMIYESMRDKSPRTSDGNYYGYSREGDRLDYDPDMHYDRPLEYPPSLEGAEAEWTDQGDSKLAGMKDKLADKTSAAKEKLAHAGEAVREKAGALKERTGEKLHAVKQRAGEMTARMRDGTRQAYARTRERVVTTADKRPLEVGLVALAAGVLVGLALPTPAPVNRTIGATADRLRDRTRQAGSEMLEKGKRVAQAAVSAVKDEAQAQGLTPERLREKATAVAERAKEAGQETAQQEGLNLQGNQSGSQLSDPSGARPVV